MVEGCIRLFENVRPAMDHAESGGIALHVWGAVPAFAVNAPICFQKTSEWGHLFCKDEKKLVEMAREFGIRNIAVQRKGRKGQHIDLCGRPLWNAVQKARMV